MSESWNNEKIVYNAKLLDILSKKSKPSDFYIDVRKCELYKMYGNINNGDGDDKDNEEGEEDKEADDLTYNQKKSYTQIMLVPKTYFDKNKFMLDVTPNIWHLLPKDFSELEESTFLCIRPVKKVRKDLLARGFVENIEFSAFASELEEAAKNLNF